MNILMESSYLIAVSGAYEQKSIHKLESFRSHFSLMADDLHTQRIKNGGIFSSQEKTRIDELDTLISDIKTKINILREGNKQQIHSIMSPSVS